MLPPGHGVVEVRYRVTHREGEVLPGEGKGGLGHRNLQGYRGCGKGDCICLSISSYGGGATPSYDRTGTVDLDNFRIARMVEQVVAANQLDLSQGKWGTTGTTDRGEDHLVL